MKTIPEQHRELNRLAGELAESFINGNLSYVAGEILKVRGKAKAVYLCMLVADKLPADDVPRLRRLIDNRVNW